MTDYPALKAEIALGKYAAMSDAQIAAAINAESVVVARDVPIGELEGLLRLQGVITAMEDWVTLNTSPSAARTAMRELLGMLGGKLSVLEMTVPVVAATLDDRVQEIVAAGVLTEEEGAYVLSLGTHSTTRAALLGWPAGLTSHEISAARSY